MSTSLHKYKHLSIEHLAKIELLLAQGYSYVYIANTIGVHKTTVSREIKRGWYKGKYAASTANNKALKRSVVAHKHSKWADPDLLSYIETYIKHKWSPEVIVATWNQIHPEYKISHTTIYTIIEKHRPEWR